MLPGVDPAAPRPPTPEELVGKAAQHSGAPKPISYPTIETEVARRGLTWTLKGKLALGRMRSGQSYHDYVQQNQDTPPSVQEWNYRNATLNQNGEPLPYGAVGWNPRGEPYYGPGLGGYLKGVLARLSAPIGGLPEGMSESILETTAPGFGRIMAEAKRGYDAITGRIEQASGLAEGTPVTDVGSNPLKAIQIFPTILGRSSSEVVRAVLAVFQQGARGIERYVGYTKALAVAGAESPIPYIKLDDPRLEYIRNIAPTTIPYNLLRYWTSTDRNKATVFARENEAWRIAYSSIYSPLVREEYVKRVQSGEEDPELLAMELEVPGAELVGQLVLDPLWLVGAGAKGARAAKWLGTAEERFGTYADDVLKGVEDLGRAAGRAPEGDAVDLLAKLARAKVESMATSAERVASRSKSRGIFSLLASGKRFVAWLDQGLLARQIIAAFKGDPDGAAEMFRALIKMASGNVDEVAEGITTSSHFVSPKMLHSQVAEELGITLRTLATNAEGKVDLAGFLKGWEEAAKTTEGAMAYLTGKVSPALEHLYPSLTDLIKQGADVGPFYRTLEAFDRTVGQGWVYRGVNTFLAAIYMGISPGYAVRNYLTNAVHAIVDLGPGVLRNGPEASAKAIENILGSVPDIAKLGLGAAAGEANKGKLPGILRFFLDKSAEWETAWSLRVYAKSLRDNMRKLMTVGRGLPPIEGLKNAGFSDDAIKALMALMEPSGFNPRQAVTAFRKMLADGVIDPVLTGEWITPKARRILADFNILDEVQKIGAEMRAGGKTVEEAEAAIRGVLADLSKAGDNVVNESGLIARDGEGALDAAAIGMMKGSVPDNELRALVDVVSANRTANATHLAASDAITEALAHAAEKDPRLTAAVQALVQRHGHNAGVIDSTANAAQAQLREWLGYWIDKRLGRTVTMGPETDFVKLWNEVGVLGPAPAIITKQTLRDAIFAHYAAESGTRWAATREMLADALRSYLDEARAATGAPLTEVEAKLQRARAIITRAEELEGSIASGAAGTVAPVYVEGTMPTWSRVIHESQAGLNDLAEELINGEGGLRGVWGTTREAFTNPGMEAALDEWVGQALPRWEESKLLAGSVAGEMRNFTLLAYPARRGIDSVLSYVYPYHYWYNRTYAHWLKRLAWNPEIIASYAKYRAYLEKIHAGAPAWWKYNVNTDELLGIDTGHPLFFNLESTLNPLNGLTGVDFNDRIKREQWWAATVDDMGKFGPSVWTPIQVMVAIALKARGDDEAAARWANRLIPATATLKAVTALLGHNAGLELDPFVNIFSGGIDPYERNRVARALAAMIQEGTVVGGQVVDEAAAADAGYHQQGPIWEAARARAANERALGQISSFFAGTGFKGRTQQDVEIDKFWTDYNRVWNMEPTLSPDELRGMLDQVRQKYPFMDSMLLARKGGVERDRSFVYNVLARIPPSQSDDFARAVGLDSDLLSKFYDEKGHIENWSEIDRTRLLGGVMLLGSLLAVPGDATRAEWNEARSRYKQVEAQARDIFGEDIWDRVAVYYGSRGEDQASRDRSNAILAADPEIDAALQFKSDKVLGDPVLMAYYGSMNMIDGFLSGQMYDQIERELGPEVWDTWDEYYRQKQAGENYNAFKRQHPELNRFMDIKDEWAQKITDYMVQLAGRIPERVPASLRPEGDFSGLAAEQVLQLSQQQVSPVAHFTPEQWQGQLGTSLYRLSLDALLGGKQLTHAAQQALDVQAENLGIPGGWQALLAFLYQEMQQ